jgi:hypothetical protein
MPISDMLRRVALVGIDISEEEHLYNSQSASIVSYG